jgi:hypothetical protein
MTTTEATKWWQLAAELYELRASTGWTCGGVRSCIRRGDYPAARQILDQLQAAAGDLTTGLTAP